MDIRIELSSLASKHQSGVAQYTKLLTEALCESENISVYGHYFDFLKRQPKPSLRGSLTIEPNTLVPLRIYAKLQSYNLAPAFDLLPPIKKAVDLTIFPNFATWPSLRTKKTATVVHDLTYLYYPEATEEKNLHHLRRVIPRSIKEADFIITVSESVKSEIIKEFNIDPNRCITTPIPPDPIFLSTVSPEEIKEAKSYYNLDSAKKYIYFIGNLEPRKNLSALIKAYCALPTEIKDTYSLILAGGRGWRTEATEATLKEAQNSGEDIRHLGFIDQQHAPALYQGASLFIMPSIYEGFGIPVLEAMSSGCPVVAADIPVLREVGAAAATYVNTTDTTAFAKVITEALSAPVDKEKLLANVMRYSWEDNIKKIVKTYKSIDK